MIKLRSIFRIKKKWKQNKLYHYEAIKDNCEIKKKNTS